MQISVENSEYDEKLQNEFILRLFASIDRKQGIGHFLKTFLSGGKYE